jgi:hypothetical protein
MTYSSPRTKQVGGSHYKTMSIQPGEYIRANELGWYEGNVVKYVTRHKQKNGPEDVLKAIHYLELILEEYDGHTDTETSGTFQSQRTEPEA